MNKRNIATTIVLILSSLVFMVVGSCFINFIYKDQRIKVENPNILASSGVLVYSAKDKTKTPIKKLEFSKMELGLKPTTGEVDADTNVPSTVTDKHGSEGVYASVKVSAAAGLKVVVKNIKLTTKEDASKVKEERENMFISLKDVEDSTFNFKEDVFTLTTFKEAKEDSELTIMFWLDGKAGELLKGCTISFDISFEF